MLDAAVDAAFAITYPEARQKFLAAAAYAGADTRSIPYEGTECSELFVDVAVLGPRGESVTFFISGTHGVEGFCGSACQNYWLLGRPEPASRVVLVHGLNPYGFAHCRRETEENIDLNRNFRAFPAVETPPLSASYDLVARAMRQAPWDAEAVRTLLENPDTQRMLASGQYHDERGLFYGGCAPAWSHVLVRALVQDHAADCALVSVLDIHSGLGEFGAGELFSHHVPGSHEFALAEARYGAVTSLNATNKAVPSRGHLLGKIEEWAPHAHVLALALEFGTYPLVDVLTALAYDNWLRGPHAGPLSEDAVALHRACMRELYCPTSGDWRRSVLSHACGIMARSVAAPENGPQGRG